MAGNKAHQHLNQYHRDRGLSQQDSGPNPDDLDSSAGGDVSGSMCEEGSDASLSDGRHSSDEGFKDALDHLPEPRDDAMHFGARDLAA
ncbi:hypothetical protein CSOJ01_15412 [Colletotrichum sojae]|uniref:Uncharacterized protein n=1 Tax=Colletotrichum sojae TaxID=2175907 RepID=A0A8H6IN98_9PEZI|nr:hypothetical protein CSOJ01_15412 [Colletotrichum sojae]